MTNTTSPKEDNLIWVIKVVSSPAAPGLEINILEITKTITTSIDQGEDQLVDLEDPEVGLQVETEMLPGRRGIC